MKLSEELIQHAIRILGNPHDTPFKSAGSVDMRRAVSACYYALFHHLGEAADEQIAPHASPSIAKEIHRWLSHAEAKKNCLVFASPDLRPPLRPLEKLAERALRIGRYPE